MESSALELAAKYKGLRKPDVVMASNMTDLPHWKEFSGLRGIPHVLYVHENQLDYPVKEGEKRDYHYGWKDYINYLAADKILFNSQYNLDSFCRGLIDLRRLLPDNNLKNSLNEIREKSQIIPPGCTLIEPSPLQEKSLSEISCPVLLWNHRWEHDKNPESFFRLIRKIKESGRCFKLIVLGESFKDSPGCFKVGEAEFSAEILHMGYAETRSDYEKWLRQADFVLSTSLQENFGISIVEAISAGSLPLLPKRLAYPEVIPKEFHKIFLYSNEESLFRKLIKLMERKDKEQMGEQLRKSMEKFDWRVQAKRFDNTLETLI